MAPLTRWRGMGWAVAAVLVAGCLATVPTGTAVAAPLIDCVSSDNGDPELTSITISPSAIDVRSGPQRVRIVAIAHDTGGPGPAAGLRRVQVIVRGPHDAFRQIRLARRSGEWVGAFTFRKWAPAGTWRIGQVSLHDRVGQVAVYGGEYARDLGAIPGVHAIAVTSVQDRTAPRLTGFSFKPDSVDTTHRRQYVRFTARAVDPQTGIARVLVAAIAPDEETFAVGRLHQVEGTAHTFRGRVLMRRFISSGKWPVIAAVVNRAGRWKVYFPAALSRLGSATSLRVRSSQDLTEPTLTAFRRRPTQVDVREHAGTVTVTLRARDTGSGVRRVYASFSGGAYVDLTLDLVSGTRHNGVWQGTGTVARCPSKSGQWKASVNLIDRRDNGAFYSPAAIKRHGWPSTLGVTALPDAMPPTARIGRYDVPATGPAVLKFGEAVNGISAISAVVRPVDPETDPVTWGPPVEGDWSCKNRLGATTDCLTGHVWRAAFTPDDPFQGSVFFYVELNPEHNLNVIDLAGNPFDRHGVVFRNSAAPNPYLAAPLPPPAVSAPQRPAQARAADVLLDRASRRWPG